MTTIYVVTRGSYSDYQIVGVFSTKEKAEAFTEFYPKTGYNGLNDIEEYELNAVSKYPAGKRAFMARFTVDGEMAIEQIAPEYVNETVKPYGDNETMCTECWAADELSAAKIANERRVQTIAANQWTTDFKAWATGFRN